MTYTFRTFASFAQVKNSLHRGTAEKWLVNLITQQQDEGFEFVGSHEVITEELGGCLSAFGIGSSVVRTVTPVLVFRKPGA